MNVLQRLLLITFVCLFALDNAAARVAVPAAEMAAMKEQKAYLDSLKRDLREAKYNTNSKPSPDFNKARAALKHAFANPYGKDNVEVLMQAGDTEYQCFQTERNKPALGKNMDEIVIYNSTAAGFKYYQQAYQLLRHPIAGKRQVSVSPKAIAQMQAQAYELYRCTSGFRATAGFYFTKKDWKSAYEYFRLALESVDCEMLTRYAATNYSMQTDFAKFRTEDLRRQLQYSCAVAAVQMADHQLAVKELEKAKFSGKETNRIRQQLCKEYLALNDSAGYEKALLEGAELLPKEVWYAENLLNLYLDRREHAKALPMIERVIEHDPHNARNLELKGQLLDEFGNIAEAEVAYMQAVVFDTTLVISYSALGRIQFNRALEAENALVEARQYDVIYDEVVPMYEAALPYYDRAFDNDRERKDDSIAKAIRTILYKRFQSPKCRNAKQLIRRYNEVSQAYGLSTM